MHPAFFSEPHLVGLGVPAVLGLGLVFGLKHATEADHVVAVTNIVSEHRTLTGAALVGGIWGVGHTISILLAGLVVVGLRVTISETISNWMGLGIAAMIVWLGIAALRAARRPPRTDANHPAARRPFHLKSLAIGMAHGLAGSSALTLLVLTQISSPPLAFAYLLLFGAGSIIGMLVMSGLVGLPFVLGGRGSDRFDGRLRGAAALAGIGFGFWYAWENPVTQSIVTFFQ